MPAWGDIVNSLLLNRQKLQSNQLQMQDVAADIAIKQEALAGQQRLREAFAGAALAPPSATANANTDFGSALDMNDPMGVAYASATQTIAANKRMADTFRKAGGSYALAQAEKYDRLVQDGQANLRELTTKIYDKGEAKFKEAAQVMQDVTDRDSLISSADYLIRNFPPGIAKRVLSGINFDGRDGLPIYDDSAVRTVKSMQAEFKSAHEKMTEAQQAKNEEGRNTRANNEIEAKAAGISAANSRAAAAQAGANTRFMLGFNAKDDKAGTDAEKTANNDLNKNELVKNFPKYAQAFGAAKNVDRQVRAGGIRDTASPDIGDMVRGYEQAINNFRSFMGGKWSAQQTEQMSGALQKTGTWIQTVGQGKKPPQSLVVDIANEVARLYQDTNAAVLRQTLEQRETVWKKRGDPTNVHSPAQMSEVLRTGRGDLIKDPDTGQEYMAFRQPEDYGKEPSRIKKALPENVVPIYDKQKEDKRRAVLRAGKLVLEEPEGEE